MTWAWSLGRRRRPRLQAQVIKWGASLAHLENLEFWKWCFRERRVGSLERARRGEEDGVVRGGQGGVGGGGNNGEVGGENGLFGGKR